jgi:hypothetical protein
MYRNEEDRKENSRQYYINNKIHILNTSTLWQKKNKGKVSGYKKKYRKNNPHIIKNLSLKRKYGISFGQFEKMWTDQNGCCAICGTKCANWKDIHVDHNHVTKQVRQLLCKGCNHGIGNLKEDVSILLKAIAYLNKWNQILDNSDML